MIDETAQRREEFVERVLGSALGALEIATIHLGDRLGYYAKLAEQPATSAELAFSTGTDERYAREWLEQQAVVGILAVEDAPVAADRRYHLPPGHDTVLLDAEHLAYLAPLARMCMAMLGGVPRLVGAFRTGAGIPYADYGAEAREAQMDQNRPLFARLLGAQWLPAMGDIHERLRAEPPARVLDLACGAGWSTITLARAYPGVLVDGVEADPASVSLAETNLNEVAPELTGRVHFLVADARPTVRPAARPAAAKATTWRSSTSPARHGAAGAGLALGAGTAAAGRQPRGRRRAGRRLLHRPRG